MVKGIKISIRVLPELEQICNNNYSALDNAYKKWEECQKEIPGFQLAHELYRDLWERITEVAGTDSWVFTGRYTRFAQLYDRYCLQQVIGDVLSRQLARKHSKIKFKDIDRQQDYEKPLQELIQGIDDKKLTYGELNNVLIDNLVKYNKFDLIKKALDYVREMYK